MSNVFAVSNVFEMSNVFTVFAVFDVSNVFNVFDVFDVFNMFDVSNVERPDESKGYVSVFLLGANTLMILRFIPPNQSNPFVSGPEAGSVDPAEGLN